jgi:hypothetical protein
MYSPLSLLLCLVALFTSTTLSLPLGPSSNPSLIARQEENEQRKLFCHYNPNYCQKELPQYCTDPNPDHAAPWWCGYDKPPALDLPVANTAALVARQTESWEWNEQRKLFCYYNPGDCQKNYAKLCVDLDPAPEFCAWNAPPPPPPPPPPSSALDKRAPQDDPEREEPEEEEEEEEEDPHPVERSWCKKHPNHPYCYSQYCIDHPGSC